MPDVVRTALPVSVYRSAPFTSAGLTLLNGTDSFLVANKLEPKKVDITGWKVGSTS